jgi:hypothetical protein
MNHKNRQIQLKLATAFSVLFFAGTALPLQAAEKTLMIRGEPLLATDILTFPPVCKLIVVDMPGSHHGAGNRPLEQYAALFERPGYEMAAHNPHLHHYCWALVSKQKYFRARGAIQRNFYFKQFMGDIDYVIENTKKNGIDWPYFHVLLIEQGEMLLVREDYPGSLAKANEALAHKPDAEKAHTLKFDIYMAMGNKKKAIEAGQEGLKTNPGSHRLRKRLMNLGISLPPLAEPDLVAPEQTQVQQDAALQELPSPPVESALKIEPTTNTDTTPKVETPDSENPKTKSYCRFCP